MVPDLPVEEADEYEEFSEAYEVDAVPLQPPPPQTRGRGEL
ncbi:MAG: hypothetical protein ACTSWP_03640 [Candidatus Freyarchaeota archaeon]